MFSAEVALSLFRLPDGCDFEPLHLFNNREIPCS